MPRVPRKPRTKSEVSGAASRVRRSPRGASPGGYRYGRGRAFRVCEQTFVGGCDIAVTYGDTPSKKNSRRIVCRGPRPISLPSEAYGRWHGENLPRLAECAALVVRKPIAAISVDLWSGTARVGDCTNKAESALDLLVDAGIIADDNWREVPTVAVSFNGIDRENPRAEVAIFYA